jgi:hypothetical protein
MGSEEWMRQLRTPPDIIRRQLRWESWQQFKRLKQSGLTQRQIGNYCGLSVVRVRVKLDRAESRSPLATWLACSDPIQVLALQILKARHPVWGWSPAIPRLTVRWRHKYA